MSLFFRRRPLALVIALIFGFAAPIKPRAADSPDAAQSINDAIVARVNGRAILLSELKERALDLNVELEDLRVSGLEGEGFRRAITSQIDEELLVQAAEKEGITADGADISRRVDDMISDLVKGLGGKEKFNTFLANSHLSLDALRRMLLSRERRKSLVGQLVGRRVIVTGEDVTKFEAERAAAGEVVGEVRLAQIFIECSPEDQASPLGKIRLKRAIESAKEAAANLERWPEVAMRYTDDSAGRQRGGLLGWVDLDSMHPAIGARARKLKVREVSEPVTTDKGYHVLYCLDRRTARDVLYEQRYNEEHDKLVERLREEATLEIYPIGEK